MKSNIGKSEYTRSCALARVPKSPKSSIILNSYNSDNDWDLFTTTNLSTKSVFVVALFWRSNVSEMHLISIPVSSNLFCGASTHIIIDLHEPFD